MPDAELNVKVQFNQYDAWMSKAQKTIVGIVGFGIAVSACAKLLFPMWPAEIAISFGMSAMIAAGAVAMFIALGNTPRE